jgi:hypothetical protein
MVDNIDLTRNIIWLVDFVGSFSLSQDDIQMIREGGQQTKHHN